jgi:hypothetical protein
MRLPAHTMPIDCVSAGVIAFRDLMKSLLHNMNQRNGLFARHAVIVALALVAITSTHTRGQEPATLGGPSFTPDGRASTLAGWHTLGQAAWHADQGEIVGNGTKGAGWLVLDRAFQDTGLYTAFECSGSCDTGVLLRLRPTSDGMRGTFLAIADGDLKGYTITLDRDGNQVQQKELRSAGGQSGLRRLRPIPLLRRGQCGSLRCPVPLPG